MTAKGGRGGRQEKSVEVKRKKGRYDSDMNSSQGEKGAREIKRKRKKNRKLSNCKREGNPLYKFRYDVNEKKKKSEIRLGHTTSCLTSLLCQLLILDFVDSHPKQMVTSRFRKVTTVYLSDGSQGSYLTNDPKRWINRVKLRLKDSHQS